MKLQIILTAVLGPVLAAADCGSFMPDAVSLVEGGYTTYGPQTQTTRGVVCTAEKAEGDGGSADTCELPGYAMGIVTGATINVTVANPEHILGLVKGLFAGAGAGATDLNATVVMNYTDPITGGRRRRRPERLQHVHAAAPLLRGVPGGLRRRRRQRREDMWADLDFWRRRGQPPAGTPALRRHRVLGPGRRRERLCGRPLAAVRGRGGQSVGQPPGERRRDLER